MHEKQNLQDLLMGEKKGGIKDNFWDLGLSNRL